MTSSLLIASLFIVVLQTMVHPHVDRSLASLVQSVEIFDQKGTLILTDGLAALRAEHLRGRPLPAEAYRMRVHVVSPGMKVEDADSIGIYLVPVITPTRVTYDDGTVESLGSFAYETPPRNQDAIVLIPQPALAEKFTIDYLLPPVARDTFILFERSGLGSFNHLTVTQFIKVFISSYGLLGLACVFLTIAFALLVIWLNFGGNRGVLYFALASLSMGWLSLYVSRVFYELPFFRLVNIISMSCYFLVFTFTALALASWSVSAIPRVISQIFALVIGIFALSQIILPFVLPPDYVMTLYYGEGVFSVASWGLLAVTCSFYPQIFKSAKLDLMGAALPLALWLITLGQLNDILRPYFRSMFMYNLGPYFWFIALILILAAITSAIYQRYQNTVIDERTLAIAQTTQMLAHDVRKPFTLLEALLRILKSTSDPAKIRDIVQQSVPSVQQSLVMVNAMIEDIIEVGRTSAIQKHPTSPESLVEAALCEVCRMFPDKKVPISYRYLHKSMVDADGLKMQRVFSNIVSNAMQAMDKGGSLWFETSERTDTQTIEFVIGNSGSFIAEEDIGQLFNAFFTKNKKRGTGLGLAIAQKIIRQHGGEIWCRSSAAESYVEFHFTMPLAPRQLNRTTAVLFANTSEILAQQGSSWKVYDEDDPQIVSGTADLEEKIAKVVAKFGHKVRLWLVEDEPLYRNALKQFVESSERFMELIELATFENSTQAIEMFTTNPCDVLICDIDLGEGSLDGFELIRILRASGFCGPICVHSNRHDISELRKSWEAGGSTFIPKPMSKIHLLKFLASLKA